MYNRRNTRFGRNSRSIFEQDDDELDDIYLDSDPIDYASDDYTTYGDDEFTSEYHNIDDEDDSEYLDNDDDEDVYDPIEYDDPEADDFDEYSAYYPAYESCNGRCCGPDCDDDMDECGNCDDEYCDDLEECGNCFEDQDEIVDVINVDEINDCYAGRCNESYSYRPNTRRSNRIVNLAEALRRY